MKRVFILLVSLFAMMASSLSAKAQEITITLYPGTNWISYPNAEAMDIVSALGSFTPAQGDIIKSQHAYTTYDNGNWRGGLTHFMPGWGYMYFSARGEVVDFSFAQPASNVVVTATPTGITATSAVVGGTVTLLEGTHVFLRGVCWGTMPSPDIDGDHTTEETGIGSFSSTLVGLNPSTTYYVRAYAASDYGLAYGNELSFTTEAGGGSGGDAPTGAIDGKFTINADGDQVYFSQGNLQYIGSAATPYWKFADNQWDVLGTTTGQNSSDQNVDRDLFGWGTSGWNNGNVYYQPYDTQDNGNNIQGYGYGPTDGTSYTYNLTGTYANADWGVYNPISNGGNQANQWRTLTHSEWAYVFNTRTTSSGIRYAKANVNDVNGVILLPDDWSSDTYSLSNTNSSEASYSSNTISATQWSALEQAGAVFLPAAGDRYGTSVYNVGSYGDYWSASCSSSGSARGVYFGGSNLNTDGSIYRIYGFSVRLAHVAEN